MTNESLAFALEGLSQRKMIQNCLPVAAAFLPIAASRLRAAAQASRPVSAEAMEWLKAWRASYASDTHPGSVKRLAWMEEILSALSTGSVAMTDGDDSGDLADCLHEMMMRLPLGDDDCATLGLAIKRIRAGGRAMTAAESALIERAMRCLKPNFPFGPGALHDLRDDCKAVAAERSATAQEGAK